MVYGSGLKIGGVKLSGLRVLLADVLVAESWTFAGLLPVTSSPKYRSLGIRSSSMRIKCPNNRMRLVVRIEIMLGNPVMAKMSMFVIESCQVMPKSLWRQRK